MKRFAILSILVGLLALPLLAQVPTGTLSGHVTDGKQALPGVAVSVSSVNLQGARTTVTTPNGDYIFAFLPPGDYKVTFELQGFQTIETTIKINAAQTQKLDATMPQAKIAEEVTVTGSTETLSSTAGASTTVTNALMEKLPVTKDLITQVALTPGVTQNGPNNALTIGGAPSYDSSFMINGVTVTENLRGQPVNLYIEDAVEETTTSISNVSAEFGRFNGGVVNTLTKSGGNELHVTARDTLNNDKWTAATPKTSARSNKITNTWEGTIGGFILKDKLWFFVAGRERKTSTNNFTVPADLPIPENDIDKRGEVKLTFSPNPNHRFMFDVDRDQTASTGYEFADPADLTSAISPDVTHNLRAFNYTGVLSDNFFVTGQYSYRTEAFYHYGCAYDPNVDQSIIGTPIQDLYYGTVANCSIFASNKGGPGTRNGEDIIAKGSWFLSTAAAGSHDIVFGVDQYKDMDRENNYQSPSDFMAYSYGYQTSADGRTIYPTFYNFDECQYCSWWVWWPVVELSKGNELRTQSAFVNDKWRLNNNWSFNIGVRYDKNHAVNQARLVTARDSAVSPRLSVSFDPKGDGEWQFSAGYGKYVGAQQQNLLDLNTSAGSPATYQWVYTGPTINGNCDPADPVTTECMDSHQALQALWNWFNAQGGTDNKKSLYTGEGSLAYAQPPGLFPIIKSDLHSPSTNEYSLSAMKRFGNSGMLRFDYINRKLVNMYENTTTGIVVDDGLGDFFDQTGLINAPSWLFQKYWAYILSWQFRPWQPFTIGGNYTFSRSYGNLGTVETGGHGPLGNSALSYPEFVQPSWNSPTGDTSIDQRHRARLYLIYDLLNTKYNRLSVSLLQSYFSGTPYGAQGSVASIDYVDPSIPAKYAAPPYTVTYYFTNRDAFHWGATNRTDLGVDYSFHVPAFGSDVELYINPRIQNVFNKQAVINGNTTVFDATSKSYLAPFDPFTTPTSSLIECPQNIANTADCATMGANWKKSVNFGKPQVPSDYQTPRRFFLALGVRF
ncbi:MAG: TonB-dependent receptor [Acidobacteriia bacterium]|nr:TonB-dependent receptor [Terriglobia bacterium]